MDQIILNVVGIYFNEVVEFGGGDKTTVKDIMDRAQDIYNNGSDKRVVFTYDVKSIGANIVVAIQAVHRDPIISRSGNEYAKGVYSLAGTFSSNPPNPYTVWQYYLFDANNNRIPVPGEQSYTLTKVRDGVNNVARIVWRLVTICDGPTSVSRRLRGTLPEDMRVSEVFRG